MAAKKKHFVVGLGGATNSGKTTISSYLCDALPRSRRISQDDYFLPQKDPRIEIVEGFQNWEVLSSLDMDRMVADVERWISRQKNSEEISVLIVEGFLVLNHSKLASLMDLKCLISIPKDMCEERRKYRMYSPPDTVGYFPKIVWPYYLKHLEELKSQDDIEYIDGFGDMYTLSTVILKSIQNGLLKVKHAEANHCGTQTEPIDCVTETAPANVTQ